MTFMDLVKNNRSYRGFDESYKFTKKDLVSLIEYARLTPSGQNKQPLKYYLAHEDAQVASIQPLTNWAMALAPMKLPHEGMCPTGFIVICVDTNITETVASCNRDIGIAAQTILLAAAEKELGGCMIGSFQAPAVKELLALPEHIVPALIIALGKPAEKIVLTDVSEDESVRYYRDDADVHYVPKRTIDEIIL
ncbi:MAG: nitroreductase family protein [Lachnospiraceae bacterium]